ncbi:aminomethyl transferase [Rhizoctonia solani AG-1 IA]|uniref:Aminomethyl transferase n=1 Tax=Thanatephorus cucumeris (strain AG1-IA) TaxID=983506 RepID=L8WUE1_THACA|nr:aminomethyl transferase [Rhizoctonia solani AG-1 IA]
MFYIPLVRYISILTWFILTDGTVTRREARMRISHASCLPIGSCLPFVYQTMMHLVRLSRSAQSQLLGFGIRRFSSAATGSKLASQLSNRGVLSVSGTDSKAFLNGIVASAIKDHPFYTVFLSAQGRVLYDVFIYPYSSDGRPGYLIDYDNRSSEATPILSLLKRHVLRSKVRVRDVSDEWKVWSVWNNASQESSFPTTREWRAGRSGAMEPLYAENEYRLDAEYSQNIIGTRDLRAPGMDEIQFTLHRILHAVPEGIYDIVPQQAFPMDSDVDLMGGRQELTVRTYHTGVIRKRIMPVSLTLAPSSNTAESPLKPDPSIPTLPIHTSIQAERLASSSQTNSQRPTRPRGTGSLLSNAQGVGLALLRLEHVGGVEQGELVMNFTQMGDRGTESWIVEPRRPIWWPVNDHSSPE